MALPASYRTVQQMKFKKIAILQSKETRMVSQLLQTFYWVFNPFIQPRRADFKHAVCNIHREEYVANASSSNTVTKSRTKAMTRVPLIFTLCNDREKTQSTKDTKGMLLQNHDTSVLAAAVGKKAHPRRSNIEQ